MRVAAMQRRAKVNPDLAAMLEGIFARQGTANISGHRVHRIRLLVNVKRMRKEIERTREQGNEMEEGTLPGLTSVLLAGILVAIVRKEMEREITRRVAPFVTIHVAHRDTTPEAVQKAGGASRFVARVVSRPVRSQFPGVVRQECATGVSGQASDKVSIEANPHIIPGMTRGTTRGGTLATQVPTISDDMKRLASDVARYAAGISATTAESETEHRALKYACARVQLAVYEARMREELSRIPLEFVDRRRVLALCRRLYRLRYAGAEFARWAAAAAGKAGLRRRLATAICAAAARAIGRSGVGNSVKGQTAR
jgi:hypothetical protein